MTNIAKNKNGVFTPIENPTATESPHLSAVNEDGGADEFMGNSSIRIGVAIDIDGEERDLNFEEPMKPPRASDQATPLGLNRYVLVAIYVVYVFASARVLFGWPHLSNMLLRDGAYKWRCEGEPIVHDKRYMCTKQDSSVQLLFTYGIGIAFCCSLLSGALLDWSGPRLTACIGQLFSTTGWILLGFAEQGRELYIPAVTFMALGADAGYLPSMNIANLFPGAEQLVIVGMCAAMSASFSITSIMYAAWKSNPDLEFRTVCWLYAGLGAGLCFLAALLFMPTSQYKSQEELNRAFSIDRVEHLQMEEETLAGGESKENTKKAKNKSLLSQLKTRHFILMYIYWPLNALFYNFYLTSAENLFGKEVNDLIGILGPVSMVPSILLGIMADHFGVMSLIIFIISSGVCMYVCALMESVPMYYVSAIFSCLYVSNFSGQMYAYVGDTFRSSDFGRVVGIISITGGLVGLLRIPLNDQLTIKTFNGNYRYTSAIMLSITVVCWLIAVALYSTKQSQQKAYISNEEKQADQERENARKEVLMPELEMQATSVDSRGWQ